MHNSKCFLLHLQALWLIFLSHLKNHLSNSILNHSNLLKSRKNSFMHGPVAKRVIQTTCFMLEPFLSRLIKPLDCQQRSSWTYENGYRHIKMVIVTPIIKKSLHDASDISNNRPVSNLSFLSELLERVIKRQLSDSECLLPKYQSAYRASHSTETATLPCPLRPESDAGNIFLMALLDLIAAFDYDTLFRRLEDVCGIVSTALF